MMETEIFKILAAGGDITTIAICLLLYKHNTEIQYLKWQQKQCCGD